ncbi:BMP family ABC transporter substrate-binding protein [Chloroflexota bacterium]
MQRRFPGRITSTSGNLFLLFLMGCTFLSLIAGCSNDKSEQVKAAFVYVGPSDDMGWSYAHDQGRLYLQDELGVKTDFTGPVAEGPEAMEVIRGYAEDGYDIIFTTSYGYMETVLTLAPDYPDVIFEQCTGDKTAVNVGEYDGRGYQGWYLAGIVAGSMTENNLLGYIAPYPIPEVIRNMNAFALGAQSVNPDVKVHPVWIFAWVDPDAERGAANQLVNLGVDVIARESDSTEADKVAQENGIYVVGYNAYQPEAAPDALLTAPVWNWGILYRYIVQKLIDGDWENTPVWWGLKEGILEMAPIADFVPADVKTLVDNKKQEIINSGFDVFAGPIKDNTGTERVASGETMSDEEKLSFYWLVEDVVGDIPG